MRTESEWREYLQKEADKVLTGWDFSYLNGRMIETKPPWRYREKVLDFLKPGQRLLDMGTGGGEFLLSLRHPYELTAVTESYGPNYELCRKRLSPLGIDVRCCEGDAKLPFDDESFDLIINRHESYDLAEVYRVLRRGGFFITQQVGGRNNAELIERLLPGTKPQMPDFNLENEILRFRKTGLRIMYRDQSYMQVCFRDIGAVSFFARVIVWEFPGFSVDSCFDQLMELQKEIERRGCIRTQSHRFILIGKRV